MLTTTIPVEDRPPESVARTQICKQRKFQDKLMNTCDEEGYLGSFTSLSTVFQYFKEDRRLIINGSVQVSTI